LSVFSNDIVTGITVIGDTLGEGFAILSAFPDGTVTGITVVGDTLGEGLAILSAFPDGTVTGITVVGDTLGEGFAILSVLAAHAGVERTPINSDVAKPLNITGRRYLLTTKRFIAVSLLPFSCSNTFLYLTLWRYNEHHH
jgi:hypothetical protein